MCVDPVYCAGWYGVSLCWKQGPASCSKAVASPKSERLTSKFCVPTSISLSPFCLPKLVCVNGTVPVRRLNLHEYQSKRLMEQYGCNTQSFKMATTVQEAQTATSELGIVDLDLYAICPTLISLIAGVKEVVVKAQILAGGRGKGVFSSGLQGGVKVTTE